jgi:hypothetical protein
MHTLVAGAAAGAVGTTVLNITTYLDMAVRGRAPSSIPEDIAGRMADAAGVDLGEGDRATNRRTAVGALLGYATGIGVGAAYGLWRGRVGGHSVLAGGVLAGAAAMATADVPIVVAGLSDPREWGLAGWLSDVVPHLLYGVSTAWAFDGLAGRPR